MNGDQRAPRLLKSQKKIYKGKRKNNDPLKVVYISSPMKVKTSASKFRALVQQLTGKNSDMSQYMEDNHNYNNYRDNDFHQEIDYNDDQSLSKETSDQYQVLSSSVSQEDTPTSSDSFLGPIDSVFVSEMEGQLAGIFSSNSFCDPSQMDVLGSYDELL